MSVPIYLSILQREDISKDRTHIVCGTSDGKSMAAVKEKLQSAGVDFTGVHFMDYTQKEALKALPTPDIFFYCTKPDKLEKIFQQHGNRMTDDTLLVTIAAGTPIAAYKAKTEADIKVVRTMPHLVERVYGIYAKDASLIDQVTPLMGGMGKPVVLKSEEEFHEYTAHAGSSPAFIAQFLLKTSQDKESAIADLRALASGSSPSNEHSSAAKFYARWLEVARHDFPRKGEMIVNETILGTLDHLKRTGLDLESFIASVRSKKGTTNAGLIFMGNPPPDDLGFGTSEQLAAQNRIALANAHTPPEDTIVAALKACADRSRGYNDDPLGGLEVDQLQRMVGSGKVTRRL